MSQSGAFIPYKPTAYTTEEMTERARLYYEKLDSRRSVRSFSDRPVPREVIAYLIQAASTAPSGAHKQPWTFCAVSDPALKAAIRKGQRRRNMPVTMAG